MRRIAGLTFCSVATLGGCGTSHGAASSPPATNIADSYAATAASPARVRRRPRRSSPRSTRTRPRTPESCRRARTARQSHERSPHRTSSRARSSRTSTLQTRRLRIAGRGLPRATRRRKEPGADENKERPQSDRHCVARRGPAGRGGCDLQDRDDAVGKAEGCRDEAQGFANAVGVYEHMNHGQMPPGDDGLAITHTLLSRSGDGPYLDGMPRFFDPSNPPAGKHWTWDMTNQQPVLGHDCKGS